MSADEALSILREHPEQPAVIVTDAWERPVEIIERHPLLGIRRVPSLMRVNAESAPADVLARALTRPPGECYDSLAAVNDQGRVQGIVRIDRLMRAVLAAETSTPRQRDYLQ